MYQNNYYVINWDNVQTLEDVKTILKSINISFNAAHVMKTEGLALLVELQPQNPHLVQRT
jgi:hypothetical protein